MACSCGPPEEDREENRIPIDFFHTRTDIWIERDGKGHLERNVLVSINLLELGIEVVKVLEYDLDDQDFLLDGEILPVGDSRELVRMPVGLIKLDYLEDAFSDLTDLRYVGDTQPSIEAPEFPPGAVWIFPFDAERRRRIALEQPPNASSWERSWYRVWLDRFGPHFFGGDGRIDPARALPHFTPSSAKIVSYFLASRR